MDPEEGRHVLSARSRGFSLIELMVAVAALAILTAMAVPSFTTWIRNARVRTVADALQSGIRVAQTEAQRRSQSVVLFLTANKECSSTATADVNGMQWQIRSIPNPLMTDESPIDIQCGVLTDVSSGVKITPAPLIAALCFSGDGRQTTLTNPAAIGVNCTASATQFLIAPENPNNDSRPLQLEVSLSGSVRLCDPKKATTAPDGCRSTPP
ncbi:pilus assembly FimT family protein [Roseateles cellulosilyticus]|uniref:Type II secretion system protein H n=1 Tax=Pelomonas cellulosilytica TaxID=2906762 RepID=A0ABS8XM05_9BURK|nr:GspH/FimT family pseudopilin [Pelomonas sp. P8]